MGNSIELGLMAAEIVGKVIKIGGKDAAKAFRTGLESGVKMDMKEGIPELLSELSKKGVPSTDTMLAEIFGFKIESAASKIATKEKSAAAKAFKPKVKNEAYKVAPERVPTKEEEKIAKIQELMRGEKEAYELRNAEFIRKQQVQIEQFDKYVESYTTKYAELVTKLESAANPQEAAKIVKQIEALNKQAEKTISARLQKVGTLSDEEIKTKVGEAKELAKTKVQNQTYAGASVQKMKDNAQALIEEVSKEFDLTHRSVTPEQLRFMVQSRLSKIENLARKAKLEEKGNFQRNVSVGGMNVPVGFSLFGNSATQEIARISKGKTPEEALNYYRALNQKINKALNDLKAVREKEHSRVTQLKERKIEIPIKEAEKSKKLQWFEAQLEEKQAALDAKRNVEKAHAIKAKTT